MKEFIKNNKLNIILALITCIGITVAGIYHRQEFIRILPLYISLSVGLLQASANRYASLIGGFNSILYAIVYVMLGLYASAGYAILFSCPVQLITFVRWSRRAYRHSTDFRRLSPRMRVCLTGLFLISFGLLYILLGALDSSYLVLDNLCSLLGVFISILTMLAYIEYTWLMLPSGIISIFLNIATMAEHPDQLTYLIFSFYSLICVTRGFFSVRALYREQQRNELSIENTPVVTDEVK